MTSRQTPCRHAGTRPPGSRAHDLDAVSCPENPGTPNREAIPPAPSCTGVIPSYRQANARWGAAFMELQFYPPGEAPFVDSISCDNAHRCAALTIDSPGPRATATSGRLVALGQARPGPQAALVDRITVSNEGRSGERAPSRR